MRKKRETKRTTSKITRKKTRNKRKGEVKEREQALTLIALRPFDHPCSLYQ